MTRDEVLARKPGREMDRLIGEHIFGYKNILNVADYWFIDDLNTSLPHYSTDIAAAWEVLRHLKGYHIELVRHRGVWTAALDDGKRSFVVRANSAPEAICKVALLAVGVSGE